MGKANFSDDFKRDAVRQITERGHPVVEVAQRLGVSAHSLYEWKRKYAAPVDKGDEQAEENRRLKRELARVTEERDILKKRPRTSPRMQSEVRVRGRASRAVRDSGHVPVPEHPSERLLCLAQAAVEQASTGRHSPDPADRGCLGAGREGLWLSQTA